MAMEAPLEERVLEKQAVKLNFGTAQGKKSYDINNEHDLGPCSPSPIAREEVGGRVREQVDQINSERNMLTVQEPENISKSIVQDMEVDSLPVQLGGGPWRTGILWQYPG